MDDKMREKWTGKYRSMIDIIEGFCEINERYKEWLTFQDTVRMIRDLPDADVVEHRRGEWVTLPNGNTQCSECGKEMQFGAINYCGNCGADMGGSDK